MKIIEKAKKDWVQIYNLLDSSVTSYLKAQTTFYRLRDSKELNRLIESKYPNLIKPLDTFLYKGEFLNNLAYLLDAAIKNNKKEIRVERIKIGKNLYNATVKVESYLDVDQIKKEIDLQLIPLTGNQPPFSFAELLGIKKDYFQLFQQLEKDPQVNKMKYKLFLSSYLKLKEWQLKLKKFQEMIKIFKYKGIKIEIQSSYPVLPHFTLRIPGFKRYKDFYFSPKLLDNLYLEIFIMADENPKKVNEIKAYWKGVLNFLDWFQRPETLEFLDNLEKQKELLIKQTKSISRELNYLTKPLKVVERLSSKIN